MDSEIINIAAVIAVIIIAANVLVSGLVLRKVIAATTAQARGQVQIGQLINELRNELNEGQVKLRHAYDKIRQGQTEISGRQVKLKQAQSELNQGIVMVKQGQSELSQGLVKLKQGQVVQRATLDSAASELEWGRWYPLVTKQPFVNSFFDFTDTEPSKDTDGKRIRFFFMAGLLDWLAKTNQLSEQVAECGCYHGHSSFMIASVLKQRGFLGEFHIFDSFEGLSDPTDKDIQPIAAGLGKEELTIYASPKDGRRRFHGSLERVQKNLAAFEFISYHAGWIPDKFHDVADQRFSFVNIDVDLYMPTLQSLEFFYPRLVAGGAINVDDYGLTSWPGCTRAVDEWLEINKPKFVIPIPAAGLILIK